MAFGHDPSHPSDDAAAQAWWRGATIYHAYVRSFADSDGDGHGDLQGIVDRLDYLQWLGISALWLSPTTKSPNFDWGYDVSDYRDVQPDLGTLGVMDRLIAEARSRGIRIMLDLVPNHTSSEHAWFVAARADESSPYRDYYVWAEGGSDGALPNNWLDDTGEVAWTWDERTQQYYLHNFLPEQPDLNWWNDAVHREFDEIMAFWYDRGVAGFRIDVANGLYKDRALRDNPVNASALLYDKEVQGRYGIEHKYNFNQPEVHGVYRRWREAADARPDGRRLLLGETWVARVDELAPYFGDDDELHLGFNFPLIFADFTAPELARIVGETFDQLPAGTDMIWAGSNHDLPRMTTRWASDDERRIRLAHLLLATLPGTYALYYGDELGMVDSDIPTELQRDPLTLGNRAGQWPRDNARAPMRWDDSELGGFTTGEPWLPVHPDRRVNVQDEQNDPASTLTLVRRLIALHKDYLGEGAEYERLHVDDEQWIFSSGPLTVALNFSDTTFTADTDGELLLSSDGSAEAEVAPWSGRVYRDAEGRTTPPAVHLR